MTAADRDPTKVAVRDIQRGSVVRALKTLEYEGTGGVHKGAFGVVFGDANCYGDGNGPIVRWFSFNLNKLSLVIGDDGTVDLSEHVWVRELAVCNVYAGDVELMFWPDIWDEGDEESLIVDAVPPAAPAVVAEDDPAQKYPEHEKMRMVREQSATIGAFLDHMREEHGASLYTWDHGNPQSAEMRRFLGGDINKVLAAYFDIDLDKINTEKDTMVAELQRKAAQVQEDK